MAGLKITKVSYKDSDVTIHTEEEKNGDVLKSSMESDTPPNPEFVDQFCKLGAYMCKAMGFPADWTKKHSCRSLSISYEEDDRIGAVVTIYVALQDFNSGVTINSPHLREKLPGTAGGGFFMAPNMLELVKSVRDEAQKYLDGDRAQRELLDEKDD